MVADKRVTANAVYGFFPANSEGDDIVLYTDTSRQAELMRLPTLRQQWQRDGQTSFRSLADYIAPRETGLVDYLGAFAVTAGAGLESLVEQFERDHDDYNSIMSKALADRLAEAFAEMLHKRARADWGFGRDESLSHDDLIEEKYRGIRPASGYPSCPDHSEKALLWKLLDVENSGRHQADRIVRDVSGVVGERILLRASAGPLFCRRLHHARPGAELREPEGHVDQRSRALARAEPGVRRRLSERKRLVQEGALRPGPIGATARGNRAVLVLISHIRVSKSDGHIVR